MKNANSFMSLPGSGFVQNQAERAVSATAFVMAKLGHRSQICQTLTPECQLLGGLHHLPDPKT